MATFLATLSPMLTLFLCIAVGFALTKTKVLPDSSSKVMAMLETWIFCPALNFMTMARYCTVDTFSYHAVNIAMSTVGVAISLAIAIPLARLFAKKGTYENGIYSYALAFANSGYIGDPVVLAMFGEEALAYYKLFCLPLMLLIYTWGISVLTPKGEGKGSPLKRLLNAPTIAMVAGIIVGLSGAGAHMPDFFASAMDSLKACMGPVAMLIAGATIAKYNFAQMLKNKKVYIATGLRLTVLPALLIGVLFGIKVLCGSALNISMTNDVLFFCLFATGAPLGLNTVVFPEAYGGDPKTGASMALISHALCVISIPIMYSVMVALFGAPFGGGSV